MITLTQTNLPNYFTIADASTSWFKEPTNTFDFVDNNANTLLVTVGDSWTYGADLPQSTRTKYVFGNVLASQLGSDWLNLALSAQGNDWISNMIVELSQLIPNLHYNKIYLICTFTDPSRWVNTIFDIDFNYISWFKYNINNTSTDKDFYKLFATRNKKCLNTILNSIKKFDHVVLKVGTHFLEPIGLDKLSPEQILPIPWYKLLGLNDNKTIYSAPYYSRMDDLLEFIDKEKHQIFKQWIINLTNDGDSRLNLLKSTPLIADTYHPLSEAHGIWANYIFKNLKNNNDLQV